MRLNRILVVKESLENEGRVALTPSVVAQLTDKSYQIIVEKNAGNNAGFTNEEYIAAGAKIFSGTEFPANTFIVRVLRPSKERELVENQYFRQNTVMLGFLFPFIADNHITTWQRLGLTTLSFDLLKSLSIHDPKNAQAAMSRIAGKLAFNDALKNYHGKKSNKLIVIGTGAAAMSAAYEALKYNFTVQVFGRKEAHQAELNRDGINYKVLPSVAEQQIKFIRPHLADATIVITAARTSGKKAPLLIDDESLSLLPSDAIVVDLAISNGGNVTGSKHDQIIKLANGVSLINVSGYPKTEPRTSSEVYAQCVFHLLTEIMSPAGDFLLENNLVKEMWVTHAGQRHNALYDNFNK